MESIILIFIKVLRRLKLIQYINFNLCKTINGINVRIPFIKGMGMTNFINEHDWLDSLIEQFSKDDGSAFIDVGVNIGQTTIRVKTVLPEYKYLGFEPNSACNFYVKQLISANNFRNCSVFNCALFSSFKILVLEKTLIDDVRASIVPSLRPDFFEEKENVMAVDYDTFFFDQSISLIKIDVEGAEFEVIEGMKRSIIKYQPCIICEVLDSHYSSPHDFSQSRAKELTKLLFSMKYSIIRLETSREKHKVISFYKIDEIKIDQWTPKSLDLNDYLFYPSDREVQIFSKLTYICEA